MNAQCNTHYTDGGNLVYGQGQWKFVVAFASGGVSGKRGTRKLRMGTTHAAQVLIYISSVLDLKLSELRVRGLLLARRFGTLRYLI